MRNLGFLSAVGLVGCALLVSGARDAYACGGCFHEAPTPQKPVVESSVVSDHRMVLSLAPTREAHVVGKNLELAAAAGARQLVHEFYVPQGAPEGELPNGPFVLTAGSVRQAAGWARRQARPD